MPLISDPTNQNWSRLATDMVALQGLIDLLGSTSDSRTIYGILADSKPYSSSPASDFNHSLATLSASGSGISLVIALGPAFPTSDFNTGSFLVREVSAVPLPSTFGMFSAGVLLFAGIGRRREMKTEVNRTR